jgi:hypothetical protein
MQTSRFAEAKDPELVLWLVGTHHGYWRPFFPHEDPEDGKVRTLPAVCGLPDRLMPGDGPQSLAFNWNGADWATSWQRQDRTFSFRWDPEEDVRYALMAGDPTDAAYKPGTQHGANRLAAVGLPLLTVAPERRAGQVRPAVIGGEFGAGGFSFAWPVWKQPITVAAIRALLNHPDLRKPGAMAHLGVDHVLVTRRIPVGKYMNFSRARPIE